MGGGLFERLWVRVDDCLQFREQTELPQTQSGPISEWLCTGNLPLHVYVNINCYSQFSCSQQCSVQASIKSPLLPLSFYAFSICIVLFFLCCRVHSWQYSINWCILGYIFIKIIPTAQAQTSSSVVQIKSASSPAQAAFKEDQLDNRLVTCGSMQSSTEGDRPHTLYDFQKREKWYFSHCEGADSCRSMVWVPCEALVRWCNWSQCLCRICVMSCRSLDHRCIHVDAKWRCQMHTSDYFWSF